MSKFNLSQLLNDKSKESESMAFKVELIPIEKIRPSEMNKYTVQDVSELKGSIELMGLQQNLLVRLANGGYEVISGHRRLKAMKELHAEGNELYKRVPCKVIKTVDDVQAELQLILANSTARELTDYEKVYQSERLQVLLKDLKASGFKFTGRTRQIVADMMGVSSSQVGRMDSINKKLLPELKEEFKEGNISITAAYDLSRLPADQQREKIEGKAEDVKGGGETLNVVVENAIDDFEKRLKSLTNSFGRALESVNSISDLSKRAKCSEELSALLKKMGASLPDPAEILKEEFERNQVTIYDEL